MIARLLALRGCRKNEFATLEWNEVDFDRGCFRFKEKRGSEKTIKGGYVRPIGRAALHLLRNIRDRLPSANKSNYVFSGFGVEGPYQGLAKAWQRMGIEFSPHCLRHAFGSAVDVDCGYGRSTVAELLGHKTKESVTDVYVHTPDAVLVAAADKVSGWIEQMMASGSKSA